MKDRYYLEGIDNPLEQDVVDGEDGIRPTPMHKYPNLDYELINRQVQDRMQQIENGPIVTKQYFEDSLKNQQLSLEELKSINQNTAVLSSIVEMIHSSNEKQDEMIELISEILGIARAKDQSEADSLFEKVSKKIRDLADTGEAVAKIFEFAVVVFNIISALM